MSNPPDFVLANIHGDIQVKFTKPTRHGLFVGINSVKDLYTVVTDAQTEGFVDTLHTDFVEWTDSDPDDEMVCDISSRSSALGHLL